MLHYIFAHTGNSQS